MITPEDLALAENLVREGRINRERLEKLFTELLNRPGTRLAQLLEQGVGEGGGPAVAAADAPVGAPPAPAVAPPAAAPPAAIPASQAIPAPPAAAPPPPAPPPPPPAAAVLRPAGPAQGVIPGSPAPAEPPPLPPTGTDAPRSAAGARIVRRLGKYDLVEELGRGGIGIVYRAVDNASKRTVALRTLVPPAGARRELMDRFLRETRAAAAVTHPNIAPVHEVGEFDGTLYLTMECVEGPPLESVLLEHGALPPRAALEIARDCARALEAAHQAGIVHRDVKPGNILLRRADPGDAKAVRMEVEGLPACRALLADFGLARGVEAEEGPSLLGNLIGTPAYMSPEQASGHVSRVDARSDVYSLGCVLYRMLTGVLPFPGNTPAEILPHVLASEPVPVGRRRPELHRDIQTIVARAMAREPGRRYRSAAALADDLDRYLRGEAIRAVPEGVVYRLRRSIRRNTAAWTAGAFGLLLAAVGGGWLVWKDRAHTLDLRQRAGQHVVEGRRLMEAGAWDEALREFGLALDLAPGLPDAEAGRRETRFRRFRSQVRRLIDAENWEGALSVLASGDEWRDRPEVAALERLARGTATLEILAAESAEADLVAAEPGILWDEETFPPLADARAAGLARPLGTTPVAAFDIAAGEYLLVFSRQNAAVRVLPLSIRRSISVRAEYRVVRIGRTDGAGAASVPDALKGALPGHVLELEGGAWEAGWAITTPGIMLRPAKGERVVLRAPAGMQALYAGSVAGISLVDLELEGGREAAFSAGAAPRVAVVRCHVHDFGKGGLALGTGADGIVRDCRLERVQEQAIHAAGPRQLALMNRLDDCGWSGITLAGAEAAAVRNAVTGGARIGIFGTKAAGLRILENTCRGCPDWGILASEAPGSLVQDNLCTDCGRLAHRDGAANIAASEADIDVRHNTTWGGGNGIVFLQNPGRLADNICAGHDGWGIHFHARATRAFDYNLIWKCRKFARFLETDVPDLPSLQSAHADLNLAQMRYGLDTDPRFIAPDRGDFRLAPGSPARGAASDGSDIGARLEGLAQDRVTSVQWIRRSNGRRYLEQGREALTAGRREEAAGWLKRAQLLVDDPELPELLRRATE